MLLFFLQLLIYTPFLFPVSFLAYAAGIPPGYTHSGNFVETTVGNPTGSGNGTNIVWLYSGYSDEEFNGHTNWVSAQCSGASMAEVFNSYFPGKPKYTIADVLSVEQNLQVWTPLDGTLSQEPALKATANKFDFSLKYETCNVNNTSLDEIINIANSGHPVIVSAPGHWLVLWKGNSQNVYLLDSSPWVLTSSPGTFPTRYGTPNKPVPRKDFLSGLNDPQFNYITDPALKNQYWTGAAAVMIPGNSSLDNLKFCSQ